MLIVKNAYVKCYEFKAVQGTHTVQFVPLFWTFVPIWLFELELHFVGRNSIGELKCSVYLSKSFTKEKRLPEIWVIKGDLYFNGSLSQGLIKSSRML